MLSHFSPEDTFVFPMIDSLLDCTHWAWSAVENCMCAQANPAANGRVAVAKTPLSITQHRFTSPAALLEAIDDTGTSKSQILQALSSMNGKAGKQGGDEAATQQERMAIPDFVMWLGLVSAVGRLAHGILGVISSTPANA